MPARRRVSPALQQWRSGMQAAAGHLRIDGPLQWGCPVEEVGSSRIGHAARHCQRLQRLQTQAPVSYRAPDPPTDKHRRLQPGEERGLAVAGATRAAFWRALGGMLRCGWGKGTDVTDVMPSPAAGLAQVRCQGTAATGGTSPLAHPEREIVPCGQCCAMRMVRGLLEPVQPACRPWAIQVDHQSPRAPTS